jgi:HEAT repeat protein
MTGDPESAVRIEALEALMATRAGASTVLTVAVRALADTAPSVREMAAYALGALRPVPAAAIDPLAHLLWDPARDTRAAAADALGQSLPSSAAQDALERAARDPDSLVSAPARAALLAHPASIPEARPQVSGQP